MHLAYGELHQVVDIIVQIGPRRQQLLSTGSGGVEADSSLTTHTSEWVMWVAERVLLRHGSGTMRWPDGRIFEVGTEQSALWQFITILAPLFISVFVLVNSVSSRVSLATERK